MGINIKHNVSKICNGHIYLSNITAKYIFICQEKYTYEGKYIRRFQVVLLAAVVGGQEKPRLGKDGRPLLNRPQMELCRWQREHKCTGNSAGLVCVLTKVSHEAKNKTKNK